MKHKLRIEELSVESFVVAAEAPAARGTVRAFAKPPRQTIVEFTCVVDDCQPTFGFSCVQTNCCGLETADPRVCGIEP
jgi:hypothetical protein